MIHARRKNAFSHCSSALAGNFCAAFVPFRIDQAKVLCRNFLQKESETWKVDPSLNLRSKISGACFRIMAMMTQRTVASDIGAPAVRIPVSCVMISFTSSGYGA
jgi:DNA-binding XRE family transcriptional regulator